MGRDFQSVAVVKAYDAQGKFVCEDIVPVDSFARSGSLLLDVAEVRAARGIRFISCRLFDDVGRRVAIRTLNYDLAGHETAANYRRPDGTIIEEPI